MTEPPELMARLQAALGAQYRIERALGHGGMGVVFLARDTTLDRPVAVKVVHPELAVHTTITERFLAEARMIARLRHPGIVAVHTAGEATGVFYYVMDYVPGESLRQRLQREGALPVDQVERIVADLADALDAAGRAGLVHRDVKPENILLDEGSGRAMLADFGIARVMAGEGDGARTAQGVAVGTPTYMSPEQAAGEQVDARSDLYALGVVAYEMLTGRPPFRAENAAAVASKHLAEVAAPVAGKRPETPASLAHAVTRALEKDPARRWQTGAEMRDAAQGRTSAPAPPTRGRRVGMVAAALGLALLVVGFLALRPGGPPEGVNPRHSILVLPFDNQRQDPTVEWLRDGSVSMLALNLSQWTDLTVVDHERLHDLLARRKLDPRAAPGLEMARRLARDAGAWTVVLGEFTRVGDSLHLLARVFDVASGARVDAAEVHGRPGDDARPLFDQLALRLLNISGAPAGMTADLARVTTPSIEAYRAYLAGMDDLNRWNLGAAEQGFRRAVETDTSFGLAYYRLSLTRGWLAGPADSLGLVSIQRATRFAGRLPEHDRAMIGAYRLFLEGDYARGQAAYGALLAKDSTDADAWYGLGDAWFHDTASTNVASRMTRSLRAFKRTLALDPEYFLAFEHVAWIYRQAAQDKPFMALLPNDSLVSPGREGGRPGLDSFALAQAIRRARTDGIASARDWMSRQPDNDHAQNALLYALLASDDRTQALREMDRLRLAPEGRDRADLPFLRGRVLAATGETREALKAVAGALDTLTAGDFDVTRLPITAVGEVAGGANLLGYAGKVELAGKSLTLAAEVSAGYMPSAQQSQRLHGRTLYDYLLQSHLFTALGAPAARLQPLWDDVADSARRAPRGNRAAIVNYGWAAAMGLFLQDPSDPRPLEELQALDGNPTPPELQALTALDRGDSTRARALLALPDSATPPVYHKRPQWWGYRHMIAAHAWHALGDDTRALASLEIFAPEHFSQEGFDVRWLLLGQARVLRGEIYEGQGKPDLARKEYEGALAQWEDADSTLTPLIGRVRTRLAGLAGPG